MEFINDIDTKTLLENDVNDPQVTYISNHNYEAASGENAIDEFTGNGDMDSYIDNFNEA